MKNPLFLSLLALSACAPAPTDEAPEVVIAEVQACRDFDNCDFTIYVDDNGEASLGGSQCMACLNDTSNFQIAYEPEHGRISFRLGREVCQEGFEWLFIGLENAQQCPVPTDYIFTVSPTYNPSNGQFWECDLVFPADECIAESVPTCLVFSWLMDCNP